MSPLVLLLVEHSSISMSCIRSRHAYVCLASFARALPHSLYRLHGGDVLNTPLV